MQTLAFINTIFGNQYCSEILMNGFTCRRGHSLHVPRNSHIVWPYPNDTSALNEEHNGVMYTFFRIIQKRLSPSLKALEEVRCVVSRKVQLSILRCFLVSCGEVGWCCVMKLASSLPSLFFSAIQKRSSYYLTHNFGGEKSNDKFCICFEQGRFKSPSSKP